MKKITYSRQSIGRDEIRAVTRVLQSDWLTQGETVKEFEACVAEYCGADYAVAVANGTAALHLACLAAKLTEKLPDSSRGITSPLSFVASANGMLYNGITPDFCDVDPISGNLDPALLPSVIRDSTRLIVPVDYSGLPADLDPIMKLAHTRSAMVIEDASHALGAEYHGRKIGSIADMTIFSFHPVKIITTGEGGMILTSRRDIYELLLQLRSHGNVKPPGKLRFKPDGPWYYEMQSLGFNYRLTDIQCALGLAQMKRIGYFLQRRREIASVYCDQLAGIEEINLPPSPADRISSYHLFPIRIDFNRLGLSRSELFRFMLERDIQLQVHYIPIPAHPYYRDLGHSDHLYPNAARYYRHQVSLPVYPDLTPAQQKRVITTLKKFMNLKKK
ncbi:MAG: UDP-4-amino-4,6-dideoxy-N-acetyl-beta-L-altrosamine transaminase [Candidatus Delongbacteria bacterium]|nr:UDP-4-amino-4,6-dideoxy-N-acetyl-beta-L-altrosamine transaminase [Candidatus Delongbacteria bacterium]